MACAGHCAPTRDDAHAHDQENRGEHDALMADDVLEEHEMGERRAEVRGGDGLKRSRHTPEPRQLDEEWDLPPAGRGRDEHRYVAQREGQ
jgi:hypothetical protein